MRRWYVLLLVLLLSGVLLISCPANEGPALEPNALSGHAFRLPPDYDSTSAYPLVVALPASGGDENQPVAFWDNGFFFQPDFILLSIRAPFTARTGFSWFSTTDATISDPVQLRRASARTGDNLIRETVDDFIEQYAVDEEEIYLLGYSDAAAIALYTALVHPDLYGGAAAEGGNLDTILNPRKNLKNARFLDFYLSVGQRAGQPAVQAVSTTRDMLAKAGASVRLLIHNEGNTVTYQSCRAMENFFVLSLDEAPEGSFSGEGPGSRLETDDEYGDVLPPEEDE